MALLNVVVPTRTCTDATALSHYGIDIAQRMGSGVSCDKLFGRADRVLKHLALATGFHAGRSITPSPVRDGAKPQLLASSPWIEKETAIDSSHSVSSSEKFFSSS